MEDFHPQHFLRLVEWDFLGLTVSVDNQSDLPGTDPHFLQMVEGALNIPQTGEVQAEHEQDDVGLTHDLNLLGSKRMIQVHNDIGEYRACKVHGLAHALGSDHADVR